MEGDAYRALELVIQAVGLLGGLAVMVVLLVKAGRWWGVTDTEIKGVRSDFKNFAARNHKDHERIIETLGDHGTRLTGIEARHDAEDRD